MLAACLLSPKFFHEFVIVSYLNSSNTATAVMQKLYILNTITCKIVNRIRKQLYFFINVVKHKKFIDFFYNLNFLVVIQIDWIKLLKILLVLSRGVIQLFKVVSFCDCRSGLL